MMIRMITTCAGPNGVYNAGQVYDVPWALAEQIILGGAQGDMPAAEEVDPRESRRETAAAGGGENATMLRGTNRGR